MKIAQFTAVKNLICTHFEALIVLWAVCHGNEIKMQMWLPTLIIVDSGLYDIFFTVTIFEKIIYSDEKIFLPLYRQLLRCGDDPPGHDLYILAVVYI